MFSELDYMLVKKKNVEVIFFVLFIEFFPKSVLSISGPRQRLREDTNQARLWANWTMEVVVLPEKNLKHFTGFPYLISLLINKRY